MVQGGENTRNHFGSDPPVPPRAKAFGELLGVSIYGSRSSSSIHGNPFQKIECVPSQSEWKDVFDLFDFETLHVLIPDLEDFIRLPNLIRFEVQSDFAAVIHGKYIRAQGYIMDSGKRVWHEDATWLKVFYGRTMLEMEIPLGIGLVQDGRSPGHPNWRLLLVVVLNRMRLVSGGLLIDQKGKDRCFHGVIALQTIREMLHWRNIFRNIAHKIGDAEYSHIRYGTFTVSEDEELCLNGSAVAEVEYLDPTKWRSERYLALGLVAWVNMRIDVIVNAKDLLQSMELSHNGISDWCWAALQFGAGKDVQSAVAFVGLLRFLFVRNHLPDECAAATHFCANEFLDRANGVPELESCLPELLGASKTFSRGFDIDTGAVTRAAVMRKRTAERTPEVERYSTSRDSENRPRHVLNIQRAQALALKNRPPSSSGVSCKGLDVAEERQVVLSAWTYRPDGTEWQVPRTVSQHIDFMKNDIKYRMSIRRGEVTCQRVGKMRWFREQLGRISEIQIMGNDIARQPRDDDDIFVSGGLAISNSLGGEYGEEVCLHVLSWLHRGMIRLNPGSTASAFVPKSSITTDGLTVNQHLSYEICRNFVFARRGHELFWLPGDGLPCFRMANCPNGKYQLCEEMKLPYGVKRCRAEIAKDFG